MSPRAIIQKPNPRDHMGNACTFNHRHENRLNITLNNTPILHITTALLLVTGDHLIYLWLAIASSICNFGGFWVTGYCFFSLDSNFFNPLVLVFLLLMSWIPLLVVPCLLLFLSMRCFRVVSFDIACSLLNIIDHWNNFNFENYKYQVFIAWGVKGFDRESVLVKLLMCVVWRMAFWNCSQLYR